MIALLSIVAVLLVVGIVLLVMFFRGAFDKEPDPASSFIPSSTIFPYSSSLESSSDISSESSSESSSVHSVAVISQEEPKPLTGREIAALSPSVFTIQVYSQDGYYMQSGSGFLAIDDRKVFTNFHVIEGGYDAEVVTQDNDVLEIEGVLYADPVRDVAVLSLKKPTGLPVLPIVSSSMLQIGDDVYAIGSPLGLQNTVSDGILSAVRKEGGLTDLQVTAPISHGSSGGPLLNAYGQVVGIIYATYEGGQNLNLAIPSDDFRYLDIPDTPQEMSAVSGQQASWGTIGNTMVNYNSRFLPAAESDQYIYHSYDTSWEISAYNKETGEERSLGIYGTNLNYYADLLFYADGSLICLYDPEDGTVTEDLLRGNSDFADVAEILNLWVGYCGVAFRYADSEENQYIGEIDYNRATLGKFALTENEALSDFVMGEDWFLAFADLENDRACYIYLDTMTRYSEPLSGNSLGWKVMSAGNGLLYYQIWDSENHESFYCYDYFMETGYTVRLPGLDYLISPTVYQDSFYYAAKDGTYRISVSGEGQPEKICDYLLSDMCFTTDGKVYAIAFTKGTDENDQLPAQTIYTVRMNPDGSDLEILDTAIE